MDLDCTGDVLSNIDGSLKNISLPSIDDVSPLKIRTRKNDVSLACNSGKGSISNGYFSVAGTWMVQVTRRTIGHARVRHGLYYLELPSGQVINGNNSPLAFLSSNPRSNKDRM
ncbi:hypothetical protein RJ639_043415 [Escallonia herrerae]|uniref:Uncharacterized protein n=1 Tax=Escallonia herrerae TaxID=1293975 RepID=A0AA88WBS7_9ASTE|nr:hypothetical protein RJ639_043415 [Escallonia herrerae]